MALRQDRSFERAYRALQSRGPLSVDLYDKRGADLADPLKRRLLGTDDRVDLPYPIPLEARYRLPVSVNRRPAGDYAASFNSCPFSAPTRYEYKLRYQPFTPLL